jgi:hypothetical protein
VALLDGAGNVLTGWPVVFGGTPSAPVLATIQGVPAVIVAERDNLHALGFDGLERPGFPVALVSALPPRAEVAIGDVDQNGVADLVIGGSLPAQLDVRDSTGASLASLGWPRALTSGVVGSPVLGHVTGGGAPEAMALLGTGLAAFTYDAGSLFEFPKPGGGGTFPTLADLEGDGTTEVLAGSTLDSLLFVYDAGTGSAAADPQPWPTFRGDVQRTGSALGRQAAPVVDRSAPGGVADLVATALGGGGARLRWTAPGDDAASGTPHAVDARRSLAPIDAGNFTTATALVAGPPAVGGSPDSLDVSGLQEGVTYYFALRAVDEIGNQGPISNVVSLVLNVVSPAAVSDVRALSATDTSVALAWTATGEDGQVGRPDLYVVRAATAPITEANFLQAPYVRTVPATVDAGGTEALDFRFLDPATRYWFALKAFDSAGNGSPLSNVVVAQTKVGGPLDYRDGIALAPGSNPSRVPASFYWQSAPEALGQRQEIRIHDPMGRLVRTLDLGQEVGGVAQWDGRDDDGHRVPAGLYLVRLASGPRHTHTRLVLLP